MEATASTSSQASRSNDQIVTRSEKKNTRSTRQKAVDSISKKFLHNFDPEHSEREKRKLHRRLYQSHRKYLYDEKGTFVPTSTDLCDCLSLNCAGCHFPCSKCSSPKCAHECRKNRRWTYESIQCEGTDPVIKNPLVKEPYPK